MLHVESVKPLGQVQMKPVPVCKFGEQVPPFKHQLLGHAGVIVDTVVGVVVVSGTVSTEHEQTKHRQFMFTIF